MGLATRSLMATMVLVVPLPAAAQLVAYDVDLPRVMLFLDEEGETATSMLTEFLSAAGFSVIDPAFTRTVVERELAAAALSGDDGAATALGRDLGAHVLLLGSIRAEDSPSPADERLRVATATLSVRALRLDESRIVSTQRAQGRGLDATGLGAREKAITQAVEEALYKSSFLGDVLNDWDGTEWDDEAYWEPEPGSVESQVAPSVGVGSAGASSATGTSAIAGASDMHIAILESDTYPLVAGEGTRGIEIVGATERAARVRGLVTRQNAQVTVGSRPAQTQNVSAAEAAAQGLSGPGTTFDARIILGPDDTSIRVEATAAGEVAAIEVTPGIGKRWAVVVGISEYADSRIADLRFADDDARAMADFLRSPAGGGVPESNLRLLVNEQATTEALREALFVFLQSAGSEDMVTVYVASHGAPDPTRASNLYVLTHDTDLDAMASTAFPMWDVKTALRRQISSERVVVIADACRSAGTLEEDGNPVGSAFGDLFSPSRRLTISAAGVNEVSFEDAKWGGGHGVFTHLLLEGLRGAADSNNDSVVTFREAAAYLEGHVSQETQGMQNPQWSGLGDLPMATLKEGGQS